MSTVEKAPQADVFDYHTTALHDPTTYATFAQPPYATHLLYPSTLSEDNDQLHYMTSSDFPAQHDPYDENRPTLFDPRLRHPPEITSYTPTEGTQGCRVYVYVKTLHDLLATPTLSIFLSFGSKRISCLIEPLPSSNEALKQYALSAEVPSFQSTGHHSFAVPLYIVMEGGSGASSAPQAVEVGAFTYLGPPTSTPSQDLSRKRKLSSSSDETLQRLSKRPLGPQLRAQDANAEYAFSNSATSPYSPFLPTPTGGNGFPARYQQGASPQSFGHHYSTSTASQASIKAPSPHTPSFSPSFPTVSKIARSPAVSVTPATHASGGTSPEKSSTPALVRTSTIQQSPGSSVGSSVQSFNPYAMYPSKATLKLNGDLDAMAEGWKLDEWEAKRRLVQFTRRQSGSTIHADFKAIAPEDRQPNSICISCIWWEEKKECYVTSVDTIFLLESLVAVRFTVEEKNRIRRNLEGFRPLTVSKSKPDSDEFFKVIMGFPNPKPRNIEKDVKVFPWKILSHALKKIIGKYSASYSSTAGTLSSGPASYASTRTSHSSADSHISARPTHLSAASTPVNYGTGMAGQMQRIPTVTGPQTDIRLQVSTPTTAAYSMPATYSYQPPNMAQPQNQAMQSMAAPAGRLSAPWDFAPFGNRNPATTMSFSYGRAIPATSQEFSMPQDSFPTGYPATSG